MRPAARQRSHAVHVLDVLDGLDDARRLVPVHGHEVGAAAARGALHGAAHPVPGGEPAAGEAGPRPRQQLVVSTTLLILQSRISQIAKKRN